MNINIELERNFVTTVNRLKEKYGDTFTKLNGFAENQLNYSEFIDRFTEDNCKGIPKNVAPIKVESDTDLSDVVINPTANSVRKDIVSMTNGMSEPHLKLLAIRKMYYEISKKYGKKDADTWLEFIWNGTGYLHDGPSSTFVHYCWAVSLKTVAEKGLYFIDQFPTGPAKHLSVFCDHVLETISWLSNRQSGAVGVPDLLIYMYYFWQNDVKNGFYMKSPEYYAKQCMQKIIFDMNQPYVRILQSAFTNVSIMDREYLIGLFGGNDFPDGTPVMDHIEQIIEFEKMFLLELHKTRTEHIFTFPVLSFCLLKRDDITEEEKNEMLRTREFHVFVDEEFARWCSDENCYWMDGNFFGGESVTSLSSCCRLINDTTKLNAFINSIGGTALQVGSVKVSTLNLRRIALEANKDEDKYIELLNQYTRTNLEGLDVQRQIIKRNIEKGLLPNYTCGLVEIEKQYSTIGITGLYEALCDFDYINTDAFGFKYYTEKADNFACRILDEINRIKDAWTIDKDYSVNIEAVPGETCNVKLAKMDSELYPDAEQYYILGNQWIPLREKCTLQEKVRLGALLDVKCGGGQIMHANIEGQFASKQQAWELLNEICLSGVIYFAFNSKIKECANGHHWVGDGKCPHCGGEVVEEYTRIVGFFRPESSFSKARKREYKERTWYPMK